MCKDRGITRPAEGCYHAHHIVPRGAYASIDSVGKAQKKLLDAQVTLEDAANGVYLTCFQHGPLHSKVYFDEVWRRLQGVGASGVEVRSELIRIGNDLRAGVFLGR
jgi:A nuclease family of the HNH/ENDO VII superfamily with conserved AHH